MRRPTPTARALSAFTLGLVLAGPAVLAGPSPGVAHAALAGTAGFCPDANGVTVIVDFQELGGTTIVRCAQGDQPTGLAALKNAGLQVTGTQRWGEAFICRIQDKPGPDAEPCIDTPPVSAYWSYWHAPNDGAWSYSDRGGLTRKPPLGSFEGWSFSKDRTATTTPPPRVAPRRPEPPPAATPPPAQATAPAQGTRPASQVPTAPGASAPAVTGGATPAPTSGPAALGPELSATPAQPSTGPSVSISTSETWTGDVDQRAAAPSSDGPMGLIVGGCIVLLFAAAGGAVVWRRKHGPPRSAP